MIYINPFVFAAAAAGPTYLDPWNSADSGGNITYSSGNTVATLNVDSSTGGARSNVAKAGGKHYCEFVLTEFGATSSTYSIGLKRSDLLINNVVGTTAGSIGARATRVFVGGVDTGAAYASRSEGDVICMAVDFTNSLIWFKNANVSSNWNDSGSADPATGTGGISFSGQVSQQYVFYAAFSSDEIDAACTLRTESSAFTQTPPSGFSAWDNGGIHSRGYLNFANLTSATASAPANSYPGDYMLMVVETANDAITTPTGWTQIASSPQGTGTAAGAAATRITVFQRFFQSGDTTWTVTGTTNHMMGFVHGFLGVDATTPIDNTPGGDVEASSTTSVTFPATTTITDGALVLACVASGVDSSTQQISSITFAGLTDIYGPAWIQQTTANGGGVYVFAGTKTTAGSTGTGTGTLASAFAQGRMTIPLRPA